MVNASSRFYLLLTLALSESSRKAAPPSREVIEQPTPAQIQENLERDAYFSKVILLIRSLSLLRPYRQLDAMSPDQRKGERARLMHEITTRIANVQQTSTLHERSPFEPALRQLEQEQKWLAAWALARTAPAGHAEHAQSASHRHG